MDGCLRNPSCADCTLQSDHFDRETLCNRGRRGRALMTFWSSRREYVFIPIIIAGILVAFTDVVWSDGTKEWLNFDDYSNFRDNERIRSLSAENVRWAFREGVVLGVYEPLALLFKSMIWSVFGDSPKMFTVVSVALHSTNAVLAFGLARRLRAEISSGSTEDNATGATVATFIWATHPLRVEAVAWASAQPYVLSTGMAAVCVMSHLRYRRDRRSGHEWYALSLASYAASVLCKTAAVTCVAVLPLLDMIRMYARTMSKTRTRCRDDGTKRQSLLTWIGAYVPYGAIAVSAICKSMAIKERAALLRELSPLDRLYRAAYATCFYVVKTFLPTELRGRYPVPDEMSAIDVHFGGAFLVVAVGTMLSIWILMRALRYLYESHRAHHQKEKERSKIPPSPVAIALATTWIAYVATLLPTLGLVSNHVWGLAADRYSYLPMMLVVVPAASLLVDVAWSKTSCVVSSRLVVLRRFVSGLVVLWTITNIFRTQRLVRSWRSPGPFWEHMIESDPTDAVPYNNYGNFLNRAGKPEEARTQYMKAIEVFPDYPDAWFNLANASLQLAVKHTDGEGREFKRQVHNSIEMIVRGLDLNPHHPLDYFVLASLMERIDRFDDAKDVYRQLSNQPAHHIRATKELERLRRRSRKTTTRRERSSSRDVASVESMMIAASKLFQNGQSDAAMRLLTRVREKDPSREREIEELLARVRA